MAYLLKNSPLYAQPGGDMLTDLAMGENVEIIDRQDKWSKVTVFYPRHSYTDPEMDKLPANFNVWESDLVKRVTGYIPTELLHIVPRPRNAKSFVTVGYEYIGHAGEDLVLWVAVDIFPVSGSITSLSPGGRLDKEQIDHLEASALWRFYYSVAGRSYGGSYSKAPGVPVNPDDPFASLHDPWVHHPYYDWTSEQYKRYLEMRRAYIERLDHYWEEFQVVPKYQHYKDGLYEYYRRNVTIQDTWVAWGAQDKELKTENFARMVSEAFGNSPEERNDIYTLITSSPTLDRNEGFLNFRNSYLVPRVLIDESGKEHINLFGE